MSEKGKKGPLSLSWLRDQRLSLPSRKTGRNLATSCTSANINSRVSYGSAARKGSLRKFSLICSLETSVDFRISVKLLVE